MRSIYSRQLKEIIDKVGEELIWRPVISFENGLLVGGEGNAIDGIDPDFKDLVFENKTVCDLGCNLGYYSFMARKKGASLVTGFDIEPKVIEGARALADLHNFDSVHFRVSDFSADPPDEEHDMGMLIDFLGKNSIKKGKLISILEGLEKRSRNEMLLTLRPEYDICRHFKMTSDEFKNMYPDAVLDGDKFKLIDFVRNQFSPRWSLVYSSSGMAEGKQHKHTVFFKKK